MKLLKYSIFLTVVFYALQHFNNLKGVPSFSFPEEFPKIFSQMASVASIETPLKQSTATLIEKIQKNELQEIQSLWQALGIKSQLFKNKTPFLAESFTVTLEPKGDLLYVYKITDNESNDWQYLCFIIKNRSWNFYGHIDLPNQTSSEPISRTVAIEDRTWLVITSRTDTTGLPEMYLDRWYDLDGSQLREVLQYNVYQDQEGPYFTKRYSATVLETGMTAGSYFIELDSKIAYLNSQTHLSDHESAFAISHRVRYLWDNASQLFENHNQQQQDNLYTFGADEILVHNYLQIENLAVNGSPSQRDQVKKFLSLCSNSSKKSAIVKILNR